MSLRIIHLTDFHFNNKHKRDWNHFLKDALSRKLQELQNEKSIDLIAFTGDLIDQGGKDFSGAENAFKEFKQYVIENILDSIGLDQNKFLIIPGNHDVERSKDDLRDEFGSRKFFEELNNVSDFVSNGMKEENSFTGMNRIKAFKSFEKELYSEIQGRSNIKKFGSSFILSTDIGNVGVACFDTSWRCYDDGDKGRLLLSEIQLVEHRKFIENTDFKVALIHHPLDYLSFVEQATITNHLRKDFDLILLGHNHATKSVMMSGFTGACFINMSPSGLNNIHSDSRKYSNGFSVVDVDLQSDEICVTHWRYSHEKTEFVLNTDYGDSITGKQCQMFPSNEKKSSQNFKHLIDNIIEDHYDGMDNHLIWMTKEEGKKITLEEGFVTPPISDQNPHNSDEEEEDITLVEIIQSPWYHHIFFGSNETGKTVLLYRLVKQYVQEYHIIQKVPVYFNFEELGNASLKTKIKEYLRCSTKEADQLISQNKVVLLIDNLNYKRYESQKENFKRFHRWVKENPEIRIIATSDIEFSGVTPIEYVENCNIPFKNYFINYLRASEIKSIMKVWMPEEDNFNQQGRLDKMIDDFQSYALPSSAMSVSLFLWSTENTDKKPINSAILLEIYIEIILEKLSEKNIYRDTFDFKNKLQLLAYLSHEMYKADQDSYSMSYGEFVSRIEKYLKEEVGFDFDSDLIARYLIEAKIFKKYQGNRVRFTYSCFFHFFLAKRMEFNSEFKEEVLSEDQYFKFSKEIDFYSGLTRSDKDLLETMLDRFEKEFAHTDFVLEEMGEEWDDHFRLNEPTKDKNQEFIPAARNINIAEIQENRPSEELLEDFNDRRLQRIPNPSQILKKEETGKANLELLLIMMANVLRNSEGVEDIDLKKRAYSSLVKYSMTWMVLYREYLIEYVIKNNKLPPSIPLELSLRHVLNGLPVSVQMGMNKHLGTPKLSAVLVDKIKNDLSGKSLTKSDMETFMSVATYADVQGRDYDKYFESFIKKSKSTAVRDYILLKLLNHYYFKTKPGSQKEEIYIDLLTELRIRSQKLPARMRDQVKKAIVDAKKKYLN